MSPRSRGPRAVCQFQDCGKAAYTELHGNWICKAHHDLMVGPKQFPPSFDQLRKMGNTPPPVEGSPKVAAAWDAVNAKVEAEERRALDLQQRGAIERFHRHVEQAALAAFAELLRTMAVDHDLMVIEANVMEAVAKRAWEFGISFAEARKPEK